MAKATDLDQFAQFVAAIQSSCGIATDPTRPLREQLDSIELLELAIHLEVEAKLPSVESFDDDDLTLEGLWRICQLRAGKA